MKVIGWLCPCGNWGFVWNDTNLNAPCGCTMEDVHWQELNSIAARAALAAVLPDQEAVEKVWAKLGSEKESK